MKKAFFLHAASFGRMGSSAAIGSGHRQDRGRSGKAGLFVRSSSRKGVVPRKTGLYFGTTGNGGQTPGFHRHDSLSALPASVDGQQTPVINGPPK
jgi:hypothetical protein